MISNKASGEMASGRGLIGARLALVWLIVGEWRAYPARLALTAIAIAVGVALGFAVHLINGSALSSFEGALHTVNGAADLQVVATSPLGFDEGLYPRLANASGVADVSPVVVLTAHIGTTTVSLLGLDVIRAAQVTPSLVGISGSLGGGNAPFDDGAIFLSSRVLASIHARPGDTVLVTANGRAAQFRIAGSLPGVGDEQAVGTIDIAAAQWRFGRLGKLDRIDVKQAGPASTTLAALLPPNAVIATGTSVSTRSDALSRAYRVNLNMLALVALLTGGFLVYSAQSLSVSRRLRGFALIRTLGLPAQGIATTVAIEGLVIGVAGAGLGLAVGYALAYAALTRFGGDLGAQYFSGGRVELAFEPWAAAGFFALGVATAIVSSVIPARDAARAAPAVALRNSGDAVDPRARAAWVPAAVLIVTGCVAALLPAVAGLPLFGFGAPCR
jgi:putative ABC transport system permease protein